jgi:hypothetical protein
MRHRRYSSLLAFAIAGVLGTASSAHAWTLTVVNGARATVDVEPDATLSILLRLDVEVHAGWLHELELVDLGQGVELDRNRPPYVRSDEGEIFRPEFEVHEDGRIHLTFPRREAPRRGEYRVFMQYRTKADVRAVESEDGPRARVVWSMPSWETGLHDVSVEIRAPKGTSVPAELQDGGPGVDFKLSQHANRTVVAWRRTHIPRMTAWPLAVDVPVDSIALPATESNAAIPSGFRALPSPERRPIAWSLLLIAVLILVKRRSIEARLGERFLWIGAPWGAVLAITALVVAIGQWLGPNHLVCAIPLLAFALHRPANGSPTIQRKNWVPAPAKKLSENEMSASDLMDGTTFAGIAALMVGGAGLMALAEPSAAILLLPIFFTGTRRHFPPTVAENTRMLRVFASSLRLPIDAPEMSFGWEHATEDGALRLRAHLATQRAGLLTLGFVVAASPVGFVSRRKVMLMVETRAQSDADDLMRRRVDVEPDLRASDGSILRLVDWNVEAIELLRVLARKAPKPIKASRGTWLLREISEPRRRAA